ncbi:MAG TPA: DUF87 domain-containing protein [Pyrinomonadaceae bacterium]|jgi:hypothetical protein|nr:DUF87 domain-containing protein [Pyrinomonadaceae bacterium]
MTPLQEPRYWVGADPKAGDQLIDDLVAISSDAIGSHTAIIAQSGSGKSFFLGRLIEEILLRTKLKESSNLFDVTELFGFALPRILTDISFSRQTLSEIVDAYKDLIRSRIRYLMERVLKAPKYVSEVVGHFYFSKDTQV